MARSFSKKGLRRDLNFADVINTETALNNLLNDLVDVQGEKFTTVDIAPIKDLRSTTMTNSNFLSIVGLAPRFVDDNNVLRVYEPLIKVKNRFDAAEFTTGTPQFFGGDGLTASYFPEDQINSTAVSSDDIFTGTPELTEIFWENGSFNFTAFPGIQSIFGGVSFTGYFKPTFSGIWTFPISTTCFFTIEFDDGSGNYVLAVRKSQPEYSFTVNAASGGATSITLEDNSNLVNLLIGDRIVNESIPQFNDPETPVVITGIDLVTGSISISAPLDSPISGGTSLTFEFQFGEEGGTRSIFLGILEKFEPYVVRIRFWVPNEAFVLPQSVRSFSVSVTGPNISSSRLNYRYLYSESYNTNPTPGTVEYGDFEAFYDNSLNVAGGTVGGFGSYSEYQSIETLGRLVINYQPPTTFAAIILAQVTTLFLENIKVIPTSITDSIEIGNYVFGNGIAVGTRVTGIAINQSFFISTETISNQISSTLTFVDHRGLGAFNAGASWTSGSTTVSGLSTGTISNIRVGDIVVLQGSPLYNRVLSIGASSVTVSKSFTASSGSGIDSVAFFYRSSSLFNNSLTTYCANVYSAETVSQTDPNTPTSDIITVDDATNIIAGQVVQFGDRIPASTTVVSITPNGADFDIELSNEVTNTIPSGQLITFAPSGTTDSKEICFPPIDTSLPFIATLNGLSTTTGESSMTLSPAVGASELKFVGLSSENSIVETASISDNYNRVLQIKDGLGNTYKILSTTT
jgi:hypothetical protein